MIQVSVIIINYNTLQLTKDCINSIFQNTASLNYEIILVDNASPDGSGKLLKEWSEQFHNIIFVQSKRNIGFGRANNLGYKFAKGKYILLLNSDTILLNDAILLFYSKMESLPKKYACIGGLLLEADREKIGNSCGDFASIGKLVKNKLRNIARRLHFSSKIQPKRIYTSDKDLIDVDYVIGADLFIRRSVIQELGFFDPDFFMYSEEEEMQKRYFRNGYYSAVIQGPKIVHLTPKIEPGKEVYSCLNRYLFYEGQFVYLKKENPYIKYLLYRAFFAITNFTQAFTSRGNLRQRLQLLLFIFGIKTINHWGRDEE